MGSNVLGFLAAATLVVITPGPDTMVVLGRAVRLGSHSALAASAGVGVGLAVWASASAAGLAALLTTSAAAYDIVRLLGAGYLVWIGVQQIRRSRRTTEVTADDEAAYGGAHPRSAFVMGLGTNLLNPKIGVFYVSFLPQFVPADSAPVWPTLSLAAIHIGLSLVWLGSVALAGSHAARKLRPVIRSRIEAVGGAMLIVLGSRLAVARR